MSRSPDQDRSGRRPGAPRQGRCGGGTDPSSRRVRKEVAWQRRRASRQGARRLGGKAEVAEGPSAKRPGKAALLMPASARDSSARGSTSGASTAASALRTAGCLTLRQPAPAGRLGVPLRRPGEEPPADMLFIVDRVVEGGAAREPRADRTHPVGPTA